MKPKTEHALSSGRVILLRAIYVHICSKQGIMGVGSDCICPYIMYGNQVQDNTYPLNMGIPWQNQGESTRIAW